MNTSIQTLGLVARLFPAVVSGEKTSTIRWRETRIVPALCGMSVTKMGGQSSSSSYVAPICRSAQWQHILERQMSGHLM